MTEKITQQMLINDIQRVSNEISKTPTQQEYDEYGEFSHSTARNRFGTWNDAIQNAGLDVDKNSSVDEEELIEDVKKVAESLGKTPTRVEYNEHGEYHSKTLQERFDRYNNAVMAADLTPNSKVPDEIPPQKIISDIRSVAERLGRAPKSREYDKYGEHNSNTAARKFGEWNKAVRQAGLKPVKNADNEVVLMDLVEVAGKLSAAPSTDEYDEHGYYSSASIKKRFPGNWEVLALEAYEMAQEMGYIGEENQ